MWCALGTCRTWPTPGWLSTDLLDFLDVAVFIIGGDSLGGLDALIVLEQGCDLQQKHRSASSAEGH